MAITYDSVEPLDVAAASVSWRFHSDLQTPLTLRVFADGIQIDEFISEDGLGEARVSSEADLEVLDKDAAVPRPSFPKHFTLYWPWAAGQGTSYFRVDELVGAVWTERARIPDLGEGHFTWFSGQLRPLVEYSFRVVPVAGDLEAAAIPFTATPVFRPPVPRATATYSETTGKVTFA